MPVAPEVVSLFNALPTPHLLLSPELVIEAVSEAYLHATLTQRERLVGQYMFDAFPDNPQTPEANGAHNVHTSLRQVLATGQPQRIAHQHYDVPDPARPGQFVERYWQALNAPVLDAQGNVVQIIHSAVDVTAEVQAQAHLCESQAAEQTAQAEAETQRQHFYDLLMQLPAQVAVHEGPDQVFTLVNPTYQRQAPGRDLLGQPIRAAWPELVSQGILDILDQVYYTAEPFVGTEVPLLVDITRTGQAEQVYLNAFFLPLRDAQGHVHGVLDFSYEVTEQVLARQQLQQLNLDLEARVAERTQQLEAAQAATEHQRQRLERLLLRAPAAVAITGGPDMRFEFFNPLFQTLMAGRPQVGQTVLEALPELHDQPAWHDMRQVYETGRTHQRYGVRASLARPDDGVLEDRYFDYIQQARLDEQGQVDGVLVFAFEKTEQVLAHQRAEALQAELLAAAQRQAAERETFYQVFAQTPAAICLQRGPAHRYEYANQAYQEFFPGRLLLGQPVAEALPETVETGIVALLDRVYQTGEPYHGLEVPLWVAQPAGPPQQMYFTFTYQAFREDGEIVGISTFAYDVTAQVLARQQREAERQRLHRLFMDAPAGICILSGPTFVMELLNPVYQQLMPRRPLLGQPLLEAVPELAASPIPALLRQVYETGQTHLEQEIHVALATTTGGALEARAFTFVYQARRDEQGRVDGLLVFVFEVSEQVQARQQVQALNEALTATNEALQESNRQLTRTNVELDTFVYTASHDLKAPITNIESIVLALRDTLPTEVQRDELVAHLLDLLNQTVARFQFTIGQLTDISRLQLAHVGPAEPVGLAQVVEAVRLDLAPAIAAAGTQLTVEVAPELVVSFSPANLRSIVYNLLSNAVKFRAADRPSQVLMRAEQTPQGMVLTVQDNGLGMSELQQRQLFGLFQRLHTHVEGTGVGLYISKRLIENAGGAIAVESQSAVGTTFTVSLPAQTPAPAVCRA